jgi:small subunit ribosomal protein S16
MLAIRMQRVGRKGHAQYRVVVQDRRFSPKSGRVVAYVGSYNPHAKTANLDSDKISNYLKNGAQPSARVAVMLKKEGVKLPTWVAKPVKQKRAVRYPEKLKRNRPPEAKESPSPAPEETPETPEPEVAAEPASETETTSQEPAVEEQTPPAETPAAEASSAEEAKADNP